MRLRVSEPGEVVQLTRDEMHGLIQTDADMSDVLMTALIYRRIELVAQGIGDSRGTSWTDRRRRPIVSGYSAS